MSTKKKKKTKRVIKVGRSKTSCASFCFDPTEKPSPSDRVGKHSFLLHEEEEEVMGVPL